MFTELSVCCIQAYLAITNLPTNERIWVLQFDWLNGPRRYPIVFRCCRSLFIGISCHSEYIFRMEWISRTGLSRYDKPSAQRLVLGTLDTPGSGQVNLRCNRYPTQQTAFVLMKGSWYRDIHAFRSCMYVVLCSKNKHFTGWSDLYTSKQTCTHAPLFTFSLKLPSKCVYSKCDFSNSGRSI